MILGWLGDIKYLGNIRIILGWLGECTQRYLSDIFIRYYQRLLTRRGCLERIRNYLPHLNYLAHLKRQPESAPLHCILNVGDHRHGLILLPLPPGEAVCQEGCICCPLHGRIWILMAAHLTFPVDVEVTDTKRRTLCGGINKSWMALQTHDSTWTWRVGRNSAYLL